MLATYVSTGTKLHVSTINLFKCFRIETIKLFRAYKLQEFLLPACLSDHNI